FMYKIVRFIRPIQNVFIMKRRIHKTFDLPLVGRLLIADPYLADPNFTRAVVLLCEHGEEGSLGFLLNKPTNLSLPPLLPDQELPNILVFQGGPVQLDTLHILHQMDESGEGKKIIEGVYWGGAFDQLTHKRQSEVQVKEQCRLFLGYSGWSQGQ